MTTRLLQTVAFALALCAAAAASATPGSLTGYVKDTSGVPQMGATVELMGRGLDQHQTVYTDAKGFFTLSGLLPGNYALRVSAPSFLPTLREDVAVASGASKVVTITLNTLFEAIRMLPPVKNGNNDDDSWKWTLRNTANRPILRFDGNEPLVVETADADHQVKGTLAFMAGGASEGYGSASDMGTTFNVERAFKASTLLSLDGNLGYATGTPDGIIRASYKRESETEWTPQISVSVRRFCAPDLVGHHGGLQAMAMSYSNGFSIDSLDFSFGGEAETIQFEGRAKAFRPYGTVDWHAGKNTLVEYRYTTTEPDSRAGMGFDSTATDLGANAPRMSMIDGSPLLENAHHHELSVSEHVGDKNMVQVAVFSDRVKDPSLLGVGEFFSNPGDILPDIYSGTFSYNAGELSARGVRLVMQRKLSDSLTASLDYGYGGTLDVADGDLSWSELHSSINHVWRHTAALKLNGKIDRSHTYWVASYRWTSGEAIAPIDIFNASIGQADPFFNLFIRQPFPHVHFMQGRMEAIVDLRNLLAQGYVPIMSPDGKTVYLVQSARSVRGGLAFSF